MKTKLESLLLFNTEKMLVSLADAHIRREESNLSIARFFYTEALSYARENDQDTTNAVVRCMLTSFVRRKDIPLTAIHGKSMVFPDITSFFNISDNPIKTQIMNTFLKIYRGCRFEEKERILLAVSNALSNSTKAKLIFETDAEICSPLIISEALMHRYEEFIAVEHEWIKM